MVQLPGVRTSPELCAQGGISSDAHGNSKSWECDQGSERVERPSSRGVQADGGHGQGRNRNGGRSRTPKDHGRRLSDQARGDQEQGSSNLHHGEDCRDDHAEGQDCPSSNSYFRRLFRGAGTANSSVPGKLDPSGRSSANDLQSHGLPDPGGAPAHDEPGQPTHDCSQLNSDSGRAGRDGTPLLRKPVNTPESQEDLREGYKLPLPVGQKVMDMIHHLNTDLRECMATTIYDGQPVVWEMFCQKSSALSEACIREGIPVQRINLNNGYDLYKEKTYSDLWLLFLKQRPRKIWVSTMCTLFCDWVDLNYKDRWETLEKRRRGERQMFKKLCRFLLDIIHFDPDVQFFWEWPLRCRAWKERIIQDFFDKIGGTLDCRIDGCRYGLKSQKGNFLLKSWKVKTNSPEFYAEFRLKTCLRNHEHEWIHGIETNRSAYYPENMCRSIAKHWRKNLLPDRWWRLLWSAEIADDKALDSIMVAEPHLPEIGVDEYTPTEPPAPGESRVEEISDEPEAPSPEEAQRWQVQLHRMHRAAGHPSTRNMIRLVKDAQLEPWKINLTKNFKCPICSEMQPGGVSSKQVPPGSMHPAPQAWEQIGVDVGEWTVRNVDLKVKFILFIDLATRYRVTETLFTYKHGELRVENSDMVIKALTTRWLMDKPRPKYLVADNAKTLTSQKVMEFLADLGIETYFPPDGESWAHGITERAIQQVKETASLLQQDLPDQDPVLSIAMATSALNNTEYQKEFTSIQWAFGKQHQLDDDELRQQLSLPIDRQQHEFLRLMNQRQLAEDHARKSRARVVLSKLKNSSIRQPIRTFSMAQPVYIWRKFLPHTIYAGRKGGHRFVGRPRWVGPGRVVFHELLPGREEQDRQHIVWVILGNRIYKTSVHSVRPLSEKEQEIFEAQGDNSHLGSN